MREKLIELIKQARRNAWGKSLFDIGSEEAFIADHLLANGIIVLPCKVGDTVYKPVRTFSGEMGIWEVCIHHISLCFGTVDGVDLVSYAIGCTQDGSAATIYFDTIGKTAFLSREEAEAALKEGRG